LLESADSSTVETGEVAMKIDVNSPAVNQLPVDRGPKQVLNGGVAGSQDATEDRTTLRTDSLSVQSLTSQALNTPAVRQDKVQALRQSVNSGEYQVDATKIADAIIGSGER
jgi:flagellar biosynthesis anti-sigma factor FlgM